LLKESDRFNPVIFFQYGYDALERDVRVCIEEGWQYLAPPEKGKSQKRFRRILLRFSPPTLLFPLLLSWKLAEYMYQGYQAESLLNEYKPVLLAASEDVYLYVLIKTAKDLMIPSVIIPFTIANAREPAEAYFDRPEHIVSASMINKLVARKYPHWVYEHRDRKLLRNPAYDIVAIEHLGFAPSSPWTYNSEGTVIAVENDFMFKYYRKEGLTPERMVVTGALYDDLLVKVRKDADRLRAVLYRELELPSDRPLLLCALPPSQFPRKCEFNDYEQMVCFWMQTLASLSGWNIIVRPHPRMTDEEIEPLRKFGLAITNRDTASLVPLCNIYVASVSATIRWAIACGIPVVNYDVYQMDYEDFKEVGGVVTVNDGDSFITILKNLTSNHDYYEEVANRQRMEMAAWGKMDGKSGERMLKLFEHMIQKRLESKQ
jgi:hypothetical protein